MIVNICGCALMVLTAWSKKNTSNIKRANKMPENAVFLRSLRLTSKRMTNYPPKTRKAVKTNAVKK